VNTLEKFLNLPVEKQNTIIDGALRAFAANGYKKTSASDIAAAAGISKAMIFHYFGTKKGLYLYLIDYCTNLITKEVEEKFDYRVTDFFDRMRLSTGIEIAVLKMHPAITLFLTSMYFEEDKEVREDIKTKLAQSEGLTNRIAFEGIDYSKFKEGIDLKVFMKMFSWIAEGYAKQLSGKTEIDPDALFEEFDECLSMLKNNFYRPEFV
jgi:TetR/AcrR family transcriptional regulator